MLPKFEWHFLLEAHVRRCVWRDDGKSKYTHTIRTIPTPIIQTQTITRRAHSILCSPIRLKAYATHIMHALIVLYHGTADEQRISHQ